MPAYKRDEEISKGAISRYMFFAAVLALGLGAAVILHILTVIGDGEAVNFLLPPVVQLALLGVVVLLSHQAFAVWRRSEALPNAGKVRRLALTLLGLVWVLYCIDLYLDSILSWILAAG